jgi:hypothetical protein
MSSLQHTSPTKAHFEVCRRQFEQRVAHAHSELTLSSAARLRFGQLPTHSAPYQHLIRTRTSLTCDDSNSSRPAGNRRSLNSRKYNYDWDQRARTHTGSLSAL